MENIKKSADHSKADINNVMFVIQKKTFILLARRRKENILNSKLEYMNSCRHRYKHLLESIKTQ